MRDGGFLALASNERSEGNGKALWKSSRPRRGRGKRRAFTACADCLKEERLIIFAEAQRFGEQLQGIFVRRPPRSSLQGADSANTDPCALGEFLLCEASRDAILPQQFADCRRRSVRSVLILHVSFHSPPWTIEWRP